MNDWHDIRVGWQALGQCVAKSLAHSPLDGGFMTILLVFGLYGITRPELSGNYSVCFHVFALFCRVLAIEASLGLDGSHDPFGCRGHWETNAPRSRFPSS